MRIKRTCVVDFNRKARVLQSPVLEVVSCRLTCTKQSSTPLLQNKAPQTVYVQSD